MTTYIKVPENPVLPECRECEDFRQRVCPGTDNVFRCDALKNNFRRIVCLCGSTKFGTVFAKMNLEETLKGHIVLTIGCNMRDDIVFSYLDKETYNQTKKELDALHLDKIKISDEVIILNVGGYIGESTRNELNFALSLGKTVRYLEEPN